MKRIVAFVLIAALCVGITGCAKTDKGGSAVSQSGANTPSQSASAQGSALEGTVEYWSSWNETEPQADAISKAAEEFMALNPGVKINITWNGRDLRKLVIPAIEAGTAIDMFDHNADTVTSLWQDYIMNLDELYEQKYPTTGDKTYKEYIMPAYVELVESLGKGSKYCIPYAPQAFLFNYNKDIFTAAGVDKVPATWDEFLAACEKIKTAGYVPLTTDDGYAAVIYGNYLSRLKGDDWVFTLVNDTSKKTWDDPACLEAAKALENLAAKGYYSENVASNKFPAAQQEMVIEEKIAMYFNGTWLPNEVKDTAREDFAWGQFAYPTVPNGQNGIEAGPYGSTGLAINKKSDPEVAKAAFAFGVYLTTGQCDQDFANTANAIPMDPANAWPKVLEDAAKIIPNYTTRFYSQTAIKMNNDVLPIVQSAVINLISGKISAEEFILEMKK